MAPSDLRAHLDACLGALGLLAPSFRPRVGLILGSGLGGFAEALSRPVTVDFGALPGFPRSSVEGHAGRLVLGFLEDLPVVAMAGRVHAYEGYAPWQVAFPARVLCRMGIRHLTVTNAAGGIHPDLQVGDLMAITDHLNLSGANPLTGPNDDALGPRFPDLSEAYDAPARALLAEAAAAEACPLRQGVYACLSGPSYETPAEIRMLRTLGADAVGMSTVPEVLVAAHMGVPVTGISCITNLAAGLGATRLSHHEVGLAAERVKHLFGRLLRRFLPLVATRH
jgi:purine-nucleoside phosphorylase